MKKKGFTLVELLVVIAIIALLMGILMPALAKVRQIAYRIVCGSNLTGIGKSMLVYAQDADEEFPVSGVRNQPWNEGVNWKADTRTLAYTGNTSSVASSFYLLVKYTDTQPKLFVCKGDEGTQPMDIATAGATAADLNKELTEFWNFGPEGNNIGSNVGAAKACSYAYQHAFKLTMTGNRFNITAASASSSPLASDRSPYFDTNARTYVDGAAGAPEKAPTWDNGYSDKDKTGNAAAHQRDGQNIVFQDTHVEFARFPNAGINKDNIYKTWCATMAGQINGISQEKKEGIGVQAYSNVNLRMADQRVTPSTKEDAFLINEIQR